MTSDRLACVDVPALPLQLLLRTHSDWQDDPVVVVEADRPTSAIVWANERARALHVTPGMKFAQAWALSARLHASVVAPHEVTACVDELLALLLRFSPSVEPAGTPGLFWLDPNGLAHLYKGADLTATLGAWATALHQQIAQVHLHAAVVVGFHRWRLAAVARGVDGPRVLGTAEEEQALAGQVPLSALDLPVKLRDELAVLGMQTLGDLLSIPQGELQVRYGAQAAALHTLMLTDALPIKPWRPEVPLSTGCDVEPADDDAARLLFIAKGLLDGLALEVAARHLAITGVELDLDLDHAPARRELIETARPTRDLAQILELLRLRLHAVQLAAPVQYLRLNLRAVHADAVQQALEPPRRRNLDAAARALARLKATFGPEVVTLAQLVPSHLPETSFTWQPAQAVNEPRPAPGTDAPLVRSLLATPLALPSRPVHEPEAWLGERGVVKQMWGPYRVVNGWWRGAATLRDYFFVETQAGDIWWLFYDRTARRWFLHGSVQ